MSGLESYFGLDQEDGNLSAEAYEKLRERMRQNAAHIAAIRKGEQKQKKKEDRLILVLIKFIQSGQKKHILNLLAKLLANNVPAAVILSVISLNNPSMQKEIEVSYMLPGGDASGEKEVVKMEDQNPPTLNSGSTSIAKLFSEDSIPLKVKVALDLWFQAIKEAISNYPQKTIKTVMIPDEVQGKANPDLTFIQLGTLVLRDYLDDMNMKIETENLRGFIKLVFSEMLSKIKDDFENRKQLE